MKIKRFGEPPGIRYIAEKGKFLLASFNESPELKVSQEAHISFGEGAYVILNPNLPIVEPGQ